MVHYQVSPLVGGDTQTEETQTQALSEQGKSVIDDAVFAATKDNKSLGDALKSITALHNNIYTDAYLNSMVANDLRYHVHSYEDEIKQSSKPVTSWVANSTYVRGRIVSLDGVGNNGETVQATSTGDVHATTEPTAPTNVGDTVVDNEITWIRLS